MSWRPHGHAKVNPRSPRGFAVCDRCGFLYNLVDLNYQYQYRGSGMQNTGFKVCPPCYDKPSEFLRTIVLPPDPVPLDQPRPEPYALDEGSIPSSGGSSPSTPGFTIELESGAGGIELESGGGLFELEVGP